MLVGETYQDCHVNKSCYGETGGSRIQNAISMLSEQPRLGAYDKCKRGAAQGLPSLVEEGRERSTPCSTPSRFYNSNSSKK